MNFILKISVAINEGGDIFWGGISWLSYIPYTYKLKL